MEPDMARLRLSTRKHDGTVTVTVAGELDIATTPELRSYLDKVLLARPGQVIIHLSGVSFIDAGGLGTLVTFKNRAARQHTALLLAGVPAAMLRLMELTKLDSRFDYLPAAAVRGMRADHQSRWDAAITRRRGALPRIPWPRRPPYPGDLAPYADAAGSSLADQDSR
jgi:anti-anti-sigma factor